MRNDPINLVDPDGRLIEGLLGLGRVLGTLAAVYLTARAINESLIKPVEARTERERPRGSLGSAAPVLGALSTLARGVDATLSVAEVTAEKGSVPIACDLVICSGVLLLAKAVLRSQSGNLTANEVAGIAKLDELHERAVASGDQFERGATVSDGKVTGEFIGTKASPGGDIGRVEIPGEALESAELFGHTHEVPSPLNEVPSTTDKLSVLTRMAPGQQLLVRTPTGAIRSVTKPTTSGPLIRETLRGPPVQSFPLRK